ncbi:serine/threonine-protein kinase mos [Anabrus simplex]|uniref:serine/threonine-protein kinase mos n=1 Tax=Anabrus simplex TaxID=316456 RepID=UPI0035A3067A
MASSAVQSLLFISSPRFTRDARAGSSPVSSKYEISKHLRVSEVDTSSKFQFRDQLGLLGNEQKYFPHYVCDDISVDTPDRAEVVQNGISRKICRILGKGSFGTVIPGKYKGQMIAVKLISRQKHLISLISEGNGTKLSHPNIVKILKVVNSEGSYGMVLMERNVGINLEELLQDSSFHWNMEQKLKYALNVADALEYCHARHILHLDVKPKNVLFCVKSNICKLCDFGSSLELDDPHKVLGVTANIRMNTVCYTAPELFKGEKPSEKADVYSFAITMWQILSQCVPYEGLESHSIIYRVVANEYRPDIVQGNSKVEMSSMQLCKYSWRANPLDRPMMVELIQELKKCQSLL